MAEKLDWAAIGREYAEKALSGGIPSVTSPQYALSGAFTAMAQEIEQLRLTATPDRSDDALAEERAFKLGDRVEKISGSSWCGKVVGTYATSLTPEGYAVESEREPGSVQIYPAKALRAALKGDGL